MRGSTSRGQSTGSWVLLMVETIEGSSVEWQFGSGATGLDGVKSQCEPWMGHGCWLNFQYC